MTKVFSESLNVILKTEMKERLGYDYHEQSHGLNYRSGFIEKTITSLVGKIQIKIPYDRNGSFNPIIMPKRQRIFTECNNC
ncbi:transposase [[Mycoplasma] testudinis]|uniref:transposase n=1 Tax=[Mycoplasma] testudinis TaxID=33924 RepID=UPI000A00CBBC|nr:transposase [[Mycoplasma] testudinis]